MIFLVYREPRQRQQQQQQQQQQQEQQVQQEQQAAQILLSLGREQGASQSSWETIHNDDDDNE